MNPAAAPHLRVVLAFGILYLVWGSTYLAIRIGVMELPPALFAGVRLLLSGALLLLWAVCTRTAWPHEMREWRIIGVAGLLLWVLSNGLVTWAEQWVASYQAALIVAGTALWVAALGTLGPQGELLGRSARWGLLIGFCGVMLVLAPQGGLSLAHAGAQLALLMSSATWAAGSIYLKRQHPRTPVLMSTALQLLIAGAVLCAIGMTSGEIERWTPSWQALAALSYLVVFGALAAVAYTWLVHQVKPALLGTYAYVNPVVAVGLGAWLLNEAVNPLQLAGLTVVFVGVLRVSRAPDPVRLTTQVPSDSCDSAARAR